MKSIFKISAILLISAIFAIGCNETGKVNDDGRPIELSIKEYSLCVIEYLLCDDYGIGECFWTDINEQEKAKINIINSTTEMEQYITHCKYCLPCTTPTIDFSKYTLLLVQGWAPSYRFYTTLEDFPKLSLPQLQSFSSNKYVLNIEMITSNDNADRQWNRAFIVNKLCDKSIVELVVNIKVEEKMTVIHNESASIIGKWKLLKEQQSGFGCTPALIVDYSQYSVEYDFAPNGVLKITKDKDINSLPKAGEYLYSFIEEEHIIFGTQYWLKIDNTKYYYGVSFEHLLIDFSYVDGSTYYLVKIN